MNTPESREKIIHLLSIGTAVAWSVVVFILTIAEAYIRFKINQDFSFLGGFELETLSIGTVALIIFLAYLHRPNKN